MSEVNMNHGEGPPIKSIKKVTPEVIPNPKPTPRVHWKINNGHPAVLTIKKRCTKR